MQPMYFLNSCCVLGTICLFNNHYTLVEVDYIIICILLMKEQGK